MIGEVRTEIIGGQDGQGPRRREESVDEYDGEGYSDLGEGFPSGCGFRRVRVRV